MTQFAITFYDISVFVHVSAVVVGFGATFLIAIVLGGLNGAYFIPSDRRLAPLAERDLAATGDVSAEYQAQARRQGMFGALAGVLVLLAIFLMVTKPGA